MFDQGKQLYIKHTHGLGVLVSVHRPGKEDPCFILCPLKTLKIVPCASLFGNAYKELKEGVVLPESAIL